MYDRPEWTIFAVFDLACGDQDSGELTVVAVRGVRMPGTNGSSAALPAREPALRALIDICGPDFARSARSVDTVAGARATFVAVPATTSAVEETIRLAAERGLATVVRGSGSKIDWGTPPPGVDLIIDTGRLGGLWDHQESTAEVGTGTPVRALQAALALRGQRLAADPPSRTATVGGMLSVNESGPLRHRFGTPADQIDHINFVDATGRLGRSSGAAGEPGIAEISGVILSAGIRLQPLPAARRWVSIPVSTPLQVHHLVEEALAQALEPSAIEVDLPALTGGRTTEQPPGTLSTLLEGARADTDAQAEQLAKALGADATISELAPDWWGRYPFGARDVALRISVRIEDLHAAVYALHDALGAAVPVRGSAGVGTVHAVLPGTLPPDRIESILDGVRSVLMARSGRAVIIAAPPEVAREIDMAGRRDLF
jgi:glycolate oxidase FAD binding subunit